VQLAEPPPEHVHLAARRALVEMLARYFMDGGGDTVDPEEHGDDGRLRLVQ
jgi:hypothetical protein